MSKEAMKLALEAVYETIIQWDEGGGKRSRRELARRIVALAEQPAQQQEPVAWVLEWTFNGEERGRRLYDDETHCVFDAENDGGVCKPLVYGDTSPPAQRKPLTDEDCTRIYNEANGITIKNPPITTERIFKAMRAAHGIKENT